MPSRKRNLSPDSNNHTSLNSSAPQVSAKRLKLVSAKPSSPTGGATRKQNNSTVASEPDYYSIKSILKEKRGRYLIDWEDNCVTGEIYKPTWEPKAYANSEAIADWQRRRNTRRGPKKRRTAPTNVLSISAASKSSGPATRRRQSRQVVNTPPTQSTAPTQDSSPRQEALEVKDSQVAQTPPPPSEHLAVQVSQHSSFDRDQYLEFLASGSTQDLYSQLQHQDSGLGSTSSQEILAERVIGYEEGVVPDSQSLPQPCRSPYYSPSFEVASDIPRIKEEDNQVGEGLQEHSNSPAPRSSYEARDIPLASIEVDEYKPPSARISPVPSQLSDRYRTSPHYSPSPEEENETTEIQEGNNQVGGGVQRNLNSQSARSTYESPEYRLLHSIEPNSQIPPLPLQLSETYRNSVLYSPCSPCADNDTMAERLQPVCETHGATPPTSSQPSGVRVSLRERLKDMRARSAARQKVDKEKRHAEYEKRVAAIRARRTVLVPEPVSRSPQENGNSKLVESALMTQVADDNTEHNSQQFSGPASFGYPQLGKMEYAIALPLDSRVSEQYKQTLYNHRHEIEEFVQLEVAEDSPLVEHMRAMLERVMTLTIHSDLTNSMGISQEQINEMDQAHWAETCSGKFEFLGGFITAARATDMHVVIMTSRNRLLDHLETFLKAYHAVYLRPDVMRRSDSAAKGPLKFTLLATTDTSSIVSTAALVIAFDESIDTRDPRVTALRAHMLEVGRSSPLVHLLVVNSAEHIEKCLPSSLTGIQRLQALVSCVAQTRHKVGEMPLEMPRPCGAAEEVAAILTLDGRDDAWTLPAMPKLVDVDLFDSSSMADSSTQSISQRSTNRKRSMGPDDDDYYDNAVPKRLRLSVPDITHISDSVTEPSQSISAKVDELQKALKTSEDQLEVLKAHNASREAELQKTITTTQQRLQEHVDALSDLQYRYEARSVDLHTLRSDRDAAAAATALAHRQIDSQRAEIEKLKAKQQVLERDLKDSRTVLMSPTVPEVAALERAKAEISQLLADKAQMEKRLVSQTKDFEFTRQQYQLASTAAAENASALFDLQMEVTALKIQATGEAARLRQLNMSTENQAHLERARQLEATLKEREDILQKKEEELRELKRGRGLATRASSAPRSPRLGSRASSPMPGLLAGSAGRGGSALRFGS